MSSLFDHPSMEKPQFTLDGQDWWFYVSDDEMIIATRWPGRKNRAIYRQQIPLDMDTATDQEILNEIIEKITYLSSERSSVELQETTDD
jgi:hypothetical protein